MALACCRNHNLETRVLLKVHLCSRDEWGYNAKYDVDPIPLPSLNSRSHIWYTSTCCGMNTFWFLSSALLTSVFLPRISAASISLPALQRSRVPGWTFISSLEVSSKKCKQLPETSVCWISWSVPAAATRKSLQQPPLPKFGVSPTQISTVSVPGLFSATTRIPRQPPELSSCSSLCQN